MVDPGVSACVITCAGSSSRMGTGIKKEYRMIGGVSVLERSVRIFSESGLFSAIIITIPANGEREARASLSAECLDTKGLLFIEGGNTRRKSVLNGLRALVEFRPEIVLIHDAARPFADTALAHVIREAALIHGAAAPVIPVVDTVKVIAPDGTITTHLERSRLGAIQTPQGFRFPAILEAHEKAETRSAQDATKECTDDTEIWDAFGGTTFTVPGSVSNRKITFKEDLP